MSDQQRVFALTICGYRKLGMDEESYHKYISENHAQSLKDLMVKNKIIDYTMVRLFLVFKLDEATTLTLRSNTTLAKQKR